MTGMRPVLRAAAAAWLLAAGAILVFTLLRPELQAGERAGLSSLVPLYFLSFPLGHAGVAALAWIRVELYTQYGYELGLRSEGLLLWTVLAALGALQWFVLVPWVGRKSRRLADRMVR